MSFPPSVSAHSANQSRLCITIINNLAFRGVSINVPCSGKRWRRCQAWQKYALLRRNSHRRPTKSSGKIEVCALLACWLQFELISPTLCVRAFYLRRDLLFTQHFVKYSAATIILQSRRSDPVLRQTLHRPCFTRTRFIK
jgi:hypothetical protein